jgi:hypothetical protein
MTQPSYSPMRLLLHNYTLFWNEEVWFADVHGTSTNRLQDDGLERTAEGNRSEPHQKHYTAIFWAC